MFRFVLVAAVWATVLATTVHAQTDSINICEGVEDNIFIADYNNCTQYYICINQQPILQWCRNNLFFNGKTQSCDTSRTGCISCSESQLTMVPLAKTCNKYIMCFAGTPILQQCYDNLQFNATIGTCDYAKNVNCVSNKCSIYNDPANIIYAPSYSNCSEYYVCMNGAPQPLSCAPGIPFDPLCNCCNPDYKCNITTAKSFFRSAEPAVIERPHMVDINCPKKGTHFYAHTDKTQYYLCVNGKGAIFTCAPGLFYDETAHACRELEHISKKK